MDVSTPCPTADALEQLLLGKAGAGAAELEAHLAACPLCAACAARLPAADALVESMRRAGALETDPEPNTVAALLPVFCRLSCTAPVGTSGATQSWRDSVPAPSASESLTRVGPFEVRARLGAGGMGEVYRAFDPALQREVAIKVIHRERLGTPDAADRLLAEARASAAVESDHIAQVYAVEVHDGRPCIVMPVLKGETLEHRLQTGGPLAADELMRLGREVAAGLAAAHAVGLIHRDVKPANVWLEAPTGRAKLLDFGLAVFGPAADFAGTPGYMAPEQIRGAADARADLFALGCVLYRAAVGVPPFGTDDTTAILVRTVTREPDLLATAVPKLPPALGALIGRLLAKDPNERPVSASAVLAEFDALAAEAAAKRKRTTRRRFLAGVATAGVLGAVGAWLAAPRRVVAPPAEPPVLVEVVRDDGVGVVIFAREDSETIVDCTSDTVASLPPGDYRLRPEVETPGRRLHPDAVTVAPGAQQRLKLALVGEVGRFVAHGSAVKVVALVPHAGRFAVLSADARTLHRWVPNSAEKPRQAVLSEAVQCVAVTPDGLTVLVATGSKQKGGRQPDIELWNGNELQRLKPTLDGHARLVRTVAVSGDGKVALSIDQDELRVWDVANAAHRAFTLPADSGRVTAAALDATGRRAVTGDSDGRLLVWELTATGPKLLKELKAGEAAIHAVALTPAGFASAGADGVIRVWDGPTFKVRAFATQDKPVLALATSGDGKRLVSGGVDGLVKVWSAAGDEVIRFAGHAGEVTAVALAPDGRTAATGGADRTARLWRLPHE